VGYDVQKLVRGWKMVMLSRVEHGTHFACNIMGIIGIVSLLALIASKVSSFSKINDRLDKKITILCVGDSLTKDGYPEILVSKLGDRADVVTSAQESIRAMSVLKRLKGVIEEQELVPSYIVWYAGVNDCVGETGNLGLDLDVLYAMKAAVRYIGNIGGKLLLIKHYPWGCYGGQLTGAQACSLRVNMFIDKLACENEFVFSVDTSTLGDGNCLRREYSSGDGLHLHYRGNRALADLVLGVIYADRRVHN
jgi:lysophospholipase L1-like esterase